MGEPTCIAEAMCRVCVFSKSVWGSNLLISGKGGQVFSSSLT